jgi:hypothetical protein
VTLPNARKTLIIFVTVTLFGGLLALLFIAQNTNLWWSQANTLAEKALGDNLICKQKYWSAFGELTLKQCHNKKKNIILDQLVFNIISGNLFAKNVSYGLISGSNHKLNRFPTLPSLIKRIKVENLTLNLQGKQKNLLPRIVNLIELNRKTFSNNWQLKAIITNNLEARGQIGDQINLKTKFYNYQIKLPSSNFVLNGEVSFKTNYLFKEFLTANFHEVNISNILFNSNKLPDVKIDTTIQLDKDLKNIQDIQNLAIKSNGIKISQSLTQQDQLILNKTQISNFKPFILAFQKQLQIRSFNSNTGFISGVFDLDRINSSKSTLRLNIDSANINLQSLNVHKLKGSIVFLPIFLIQNTAKISSLKDKTPNSIFKFLQIQKIDLTLGENQINDLISVRLKNFVISAGFIKGKIYYDSQTNFNGQFILNNVAAHSLKEDLGIKNGNGLINIANEKANFQLTALNAYPAQQKPEIIKVSGFILLSPPFKGTLNIDIPQISFSQNKIISTQHSTKIELQNLKSSINFTNKQAKITALSGLVKNITISSLEENSQPLILHDGKLHLTASNKFELSNLILNTNEGKTIITMNAPADLMNSAGLNTSIQTNIGLSDIKSLISLISPKNTSALKDYKFAGLISGDIQVSNKTLHKLDLKLNNIEIDHNNIQLVNSLNGDLKLGKNNNIVLQNVNGNFNNINKFTLSGIYTIPDQSNEFANKHNSRLNINAFINPQNINEFMKSINPNFVPKIVFDEGVYIPLSLILKPSNTKTIDLEFSSNFHKMQLYEGKIHLAQDLSKMETITGNAFLDLTSKEFNISDLFYSGKEFGILTQISGYPNKLNFSVESSPLLDLGEIATLWSDDLASGQFRGKISAKDFNPQDNSTWIQNLQAAMYSEEDVHDFEYGILYGKHFRFDMNTKDGNGFLSLQTKKGKIKNLQVTNLNSNVEIKNGLEAILQNFSFETADGKANMNGNINLTSGQTFLNGAMNDVNIETVSNNLFSNIGNYNGKGDLSYKLNGDFINLLKSKPPQNATGDFALKDGVMKQIAQLSKGLNLANLVFGMPLYFSLSTVSHILQPEQDAAFSSITGKWSFNDTIKRIILKDVIYTGTNALYMSLDGHWDFASKDLNFDVYGFLPKRPQQFRINKYKEEILQSQYSIMQTADQSRHFRFKVQGNIQNPNSIQSSVKNSIKFVRDWRTGEVKERFIIK